MFKSLLAITIALMLVMMYTIFKMVTTGRIRAKGAKKRRRNILPFIYKKRDKVALT